MKFDPVPPYSQGMSKTTNDAANTRNDEIMAELETIELASAVETDPAILDILFARRERAYAAAKAITYTCEGCGAKLQSSYGYKLRYCHSGCADLAFNNSR